MSGRFFDNDDKLGRKRYADFLKTIIDNSDKYKRNSSEESYVIAVDSSWGTGKTYFLDMFENYLLGYDGEHTVNDNSNYTVVRFDAWKSDFWDNAFEPFVSSIVENDIFFTDAEAKNAKELVKGFANSAITIAKGVVKKKLEDYISPEDVEKALEQSSSNMKNFMLHETALFPEYQKFKQGIEEFKKTLGSIISSDKKIIIIIDELDRCKPTFAIQLLEIVKHLFDIKGITFLFLIDIEQLSYSIQTVYGQGMDATGYLCRFFDYITRMPRPDIRTYIENQMMGIRLFGSSKSTKKLVDYFVDVSERFILSLRDIDTIVCSYRIMIDLFLRKYSVLEAHCQYLFYLVLKYKNVEVFNNIFLNGRLQDDIVFHYSQLFPEMSSVIGYIDMPIENLPYKIISKQYSQGMKDGQGVATIIGKVEDNAIKIKSKGGRLLKTSPIRITDDLRLDNLLFAPDIQKWEEIKHMKYGQYIHLQLEMFNFVHERIEDDEIRE